MLDQKEILRLLKRLNEKLSEGQIQAEIGIVGGAAMSLLFQNRMATKDIDAIFEPASKIREMAAQIAKEEKLPKDWLNDAVKGFLSPHLKKQNFLELSHLRVWIPPKEYLLAMKSMSARFDSADKEDLLMLIKDLGVKNPEQIFELIESYYPKSKIPPKTKFFVEEIFYSD